jgi:hypothetical protein
VSRINRAFTMLQRTNTLSTIQYSMPLDDKLDRRSTCWMRTLSTSAVCEFSVARSVLSQTLSNVTCWRDFIT